MREQLQLSKLPNFTSSLTLATLALAETFLTSLWREEVSAEEEEAGDIDNDEDDELDGEGVNITAVNLAWLSCPPWRKEDDVGLLWEIWATCILLSLVLFLSKFKGGTTLCDPILHGFICSGLSLEISQAMSSFPEMESLGRHRSILGGGGGRPGPSSTLRRRSRPPARCGRV